MTAPAGSNIPASLRRLPQWVVYRREANEMGKLTKLPYQPHAPSYKASSTNCDTWSTFDDACAAVRNFGNRLDGVGFVFTATDPYCGIDLDHCVQPDGELTPFAQRIVDELDSYAEFSPSGDGIHVLVKADVPQGKKNQRIEIYSKGRYFTVTGRHVEGTPVTVNDRQDVVMRIWTEEFPERPQDEAQRPVEPVSMDDQRILQKARTASNGARFMALFDRGETDASASEADLALCNMLAFWTGRDPARMDQLFRASALMRQKWDERHYGDGRTYGQATIEKAIAGATETFSGGGVQASGPIYGRDTYTTAGGEHVDKETGEIGATVPVIPPLEGRVDLWPFIEGTMPDPDWIIEGVLLGGMVTLFHGEPGCGKTILALHYARELVRAGQPVLFVDEESGAPMTAARLKAMGINEDEAARIHYFAFPGITLTEAPSLLALVDEVCPAMVVFDSMADVLSASGLDENVAPDVTKWMVGMAVAVSRSEVAPAVVLLDHNTKDGENVKYSRGSGAKKAKSDVMWYVRKMVEFDAESMGRVKIERTKNRPGIVPESMVYAVGGDDGRLVVEPFDASRHVIVSDREIDRLALDAIEEAGISGISNGELQLAINRSKPTVTAVASRLEKQGQIERRGVTTNVRYVFITRLVSRVDSDDQPSQLG